ncbi:hypothetical protein FG386_002760 [Cryptosporidium ryanae]|uniref:uncharacterized protein n=1 Tax=Cryptosporidium ryanae TaxID=515981 RepID=UPI00351A8C3C|nr:hypothetical protein FG386_002760 [Cryptosporidium ryanae]
MSKRSADYQLTNENYDKFEKSEEVSGEQGFIGKEGDVDDESICETLTNSKEEIASRRIVRVKKRYDNLKNAPLQTSLESGEDSGDVSKNVGKEVANIQGDQKEDNGGEGKDDKKDDDSNSDFDGEDKDSGDKSGVDCDKEKEKKAGNDDYLPFGSTGLSSSFKNPFISLATNNESNFLFSGFGNDSTKSKGEGLFGGFGDGAKSEENDLLSTDEFANNDKESNDEEITKKAFTGEENEETVYQCKNVDLFILKELEDSQKAFRKMGNGIIHLNIPKNSDDSVFCESSDDKNSNNEKSNEGENSGDSPLSSNQQPRIIFRQSGIYKVLLNTPLNKEISKTFQRNNNIRKGYAVNFVAFNEGSEVIQCMIRFQNEIELDGFIEKVNKTTDN